MKWSLRLGRIAGIDVQIHLTFLILLAWVGISHYLQRRSVEDALGGLVFILALFGIVVLHEFGHALTARRFGIRTRDITLLPIGGVARLERMPEDPKQELLVALAGPAVNVGLAVLLAVFLVPATIAAGIADFHLVGGNLLAKLLWVNVSLAVFNMIPAFPMDGGRVLRALLAMKMDYVRATSAAATIGQGLALVFGFLGLFYNPFLVFIALFVWMGAAGEASMVQIRSALGGIPIRMAMITDYRALSPEEPLARAVDHVLAGFQQDFPVVDSSGRVLGILARTDLMAALAQDGMEARVGDVMKRDFSTAAPSEMADLVFARLNECQCHTLPVVQNDRLVGMVTADNVGEFLMIQSALKARGASGGRHPAVRPVAP
jgi:Zn-dependent protease/predicted transcriptional regulator